MRNPLMIPELYHMVLDSFHRLRSDLRARRALIALAQTCRVLSEPALDRLWRNLDSLIPLIRCYTSVDQVKNMTPPTPFQLVVIHRYACRVRKLTIGDVASVRFLRCMDMEPSCLFPKMTHLRTFLYYPFPHTIFIQRLLSPTLISLEVNLIEANEAVLLLFFYNFTFLCRNLRSVNFRFSRPPRSETTIQALSRAICSQEHLERVILGAPVDSVALTYLCALPTLKELSIHLSEGSRLQTGLADPPFSHAELLKFTTPNLDLVTSLLQPGHQIFHTFRLYCPSLQTSESFVALLNSLSSQSYPNPLRHLVLSIGETSRPMPADHIESEVMRYCLSYRTLEPLMALWSLRELTIQWSEQVSLNDDELANLASSWPSLEVFYIHCSRGGCLSSPTKYPTLLGLLSLAHSCPELRQITLPLDAREVPEVEEIMTNKGHCFYLMAVGSPINKARPVAKFLFKHLPSLTTVCASQPLWASVEQTLAYQEAWQQVNDNLREFKRWSSDSLQ